MVLPFEKSETYSLLLNWLRDGNIAVIPCDTIYGIVGIVPETDELIRKVKGRGETNPFLQLAGTLKAVETISAQKLPPELTSLWPGPVTFIIEDTDGFTRAIRIPDDPFLQRLLNDLNLFLYSTSVNKSGSPHLDRIGSIADIFSGEIGLIVDNGDLPGGKPSTLVDIHRKPFKILRQGELVIPGHLLT